MSYHCNGKTNCGEYPFSNDCYKPSRYCKPVCQPICQPVCQPVCQPLPIVCCPTGPVPVPVDVYGYQYNTAAETVVSGGEVLFNNNGPGLGVTYGSIVVSRTGTYAADYTVVAETPLAIQFALERNSNVLLGTQAGLDSTIISQLTSLQTTINGISTQVNTVSTDNAALNVAIVSGFVPTGVPLDVGIALDVLSADVATLVNDKTVLVNAYSTLLPFLNPLICPPTTDVLLARLTAVASAISALISDTAVIGADLLSLSFAVSSAFADFGTPVPVSIVTAFATISRSLSDLLPLLDIANAQILDLINQVQFPAQRSISSSSIINLAAGDRVSLNNIGCNSVFLPHIVSPSSGVSLINASLRLFSL